jgi:hypothetical protein
MKGKCYPGLKKSEAMEILPYLKIDEKNQLLIDEEGWWK